LLNDLARKLFFGGQGEMRDRTYEDQLNAASSLNLLLAAVIRITGGNFRLLDRLMTQIARVMEINELSAMTTQVVEAARESLVIGTA
jgi:TnpA family transposase